MKNALSSQAQTKNTDPGDGVRFSRYERQGGEFSKALTAAEWTKYNYAMTSGVDAGLRISDHSILVECEEGEFSYKLVIYDKEVEEKTIKSVYGIGKNIYNEDITNFDAKHIGEFITTLEDESYDNKKVLEGILRYYSRNFACVLGRYSGKSNRFNGYRPKISENTRNSRQQTNGRDVSQGVRKSQVDYSQNRKSYKSTKELNTNAVEYFGTTFNWNETGYILTNGKRLDFSGRHEGASGGYRTVDHRAIWDIYPEDEQEKFSVGEAMIDFMSRGNIRIMPESFGINLSSLPTKSQEEALDSFISKARGEVVLDIDNKKGDTTFSVEYPKGTYSKKIIADIRKYFEDGTEPYISELSKFRFSRQMSSSARKILDSSPELTMIFKELRQI